jgi:acetyl esterase/lipase
MTSEPTQTTTPPEPTPTDVPPEPTETPTPLPTPTTTAPEVIRNVAYVPDAFRVQQLDIYLPVGFEPPYPVLFGIHGGGGDKSELGSMARYFAARGYAVVSINHRQFPDATFDVAAGDVFCALAWTVANAETYQLDSEHVFAVGHSAGGTLAALVGALDAPTPYLADCTTPLPEGWRVAGTITFTGIFDYTDEDLPSPSLRSYFVDYLGGTLDEIPETWAAASPVTWIDASDPPFLLIHGEADRSVPAGYSERFAAALEETGVDTELMVVPDADHYGIINSEACFEAIEAFVEDK